MSEELGLGVADGESRWIGIRRHQAVFVIVGVGIIGEWLTHGHRASIEVALGLGMLACAVPTTDGLTVGERVRTAFSFLVRSRWTSLVVVRSAQGVNIEARGASTVRGFELQHRGRLDLSAQSRLNATAIADFADALAATERTRHFSLHVITNAEHVATLLAVPSDVSAPTGWRVNNELAVAAIRADGTTGRSALFERWSYVRDDREVIRVLRVRDFSAVPDGHDLLDRLQFASPHQDVVVHVEVLGGVRAHRLAARAVHRVGSDDATSRAAGFRRTAQASRTLERLRQRERQVVEGTALLRLAVFLVIRATSLSELRRDVKVVTQCAQESGLRCEAGFGRQAPWYCQQLPGGPGW